MNVTSVSAFVLMGTATVVVISSSSCTRWCIARDSAGLWRIARRILADAMRRIGEPGYGRSSNESEWLAVKSRGLHSIIQQSVMGICSSRTIEMVS